MEIITQLASDVLLAVFGAVLTFAAGRIGACLSRLFRDKWQDESVRKVADTCVRAAEQMYREKSGSEKLDRALLMAQKMLEKKNIRISAAEMRYLLEAALSQAKSSFSAK